MKILKTMNGLSQEEFEFYAKRYPIIRDEGWEYTGAGFGDIAFLKCFLGSETEDPHGIVHKSWMVGIVWFPASFCYVWGASTAGSGVKDKLDISLDAPHDQVYSAAKQKAFEYFRQEEERYQEWLAKHTQPFLENKPQNS